MLNIEGTTQAVFNCLSIQVDTPEGRMFVIVVEDDTGKPIAIDIKVGKAGIPLQAWAISMCRVLTLCLDKGATLEDLIEQLSGQRTDKSRTTNGVEITSGPEGIFVALMKYRQDKFQRTREQLGVANDDDAERKGRAPRLAR